MSELSSIKSQALTERIEERLFAYILDNHLKVGAKLPNEHELAAHFEVSRGTVREAVKLLVSRGVLRVKHGSGTYVASDASPVWSAPSAGAAEPSACSCTAR